MENDRESANFLARTYKVAKLIAIATASVVGFIISLVALDVSKGHWWVDIKFPLYGTVTIVTIAFVLCTGISIWLTLVVRDALDSRSYYRNEVKGLKAKISTLRDMAYNDPITGIPNSNKLKEDLNKQPSDRPRCLILLDLKNFGEINKKFNHWVGDEYLRRFSEMITDSGRRNEFLFKVRPEEDGQKKQEGKFSSGGEIKAFRKNSGGDEFFILLEGTPVDGIGYLNRLVKRAPEFVRMASDIMEKNHPFGFCAGVVAIAYHEPYKSVLKRVSECLRLAQEQDSRREVYWIQSELPPERTPAQEKMLEEADLLFGKARGNSNSST